MTSMLISCKLVRYKFKELLLLLLMELSSIIYLSHHVYDIQNVGRYGYRWVRLTKYINHWRNTSTACPQDQAGSKRTINPITVAASGPSGSVTYRRVATTNVVLTACNPTSAEWHRTM